MSEVVNDVVKETTNDVVDETKQVVDDMPVPQTMDYEQKVYFSDKFVEDVVNSLGELAYAETHQIIDFVKDNKDGVPINLTNQLLNQLATFPYNVVNGLMHNIENNQNLYFTLKDK